jgi:hypothetical protein
LDYRDYFRSAYGWNTTSTTNPTSFIYRPTHVDAVTSAWGTECSNFVYKDGGFVPWQSDYEKAVDELQDNPIRDDILDMCEECSEVV